MAVAALVGIASTTSYVQERFADISRLIGLGILSGYIQEDPVLSTIVSVALGFTLGGPAGAFIAAITSPLSPLDPGVKQAIGWAWTAVMVGYSIHQNVQAAKLTADDNIQTIAEEHSLKPDSLQATAKESNKSLIMKAAEKIRDKSVRGIIAANGTDIQSVAQEFSVDENLIRGIIYEEQTHLAIGEALAESLGMGNTVGLGQVTVGLNEYTRSQLLNPTTNIRAIAEHLSNIQASPLIDIQNRIASIATKYNCGSCTSITNYGRRVADFRKGFAIIYGGQ